MPAHTPAEICTLFQRAMAAGNLDALLAVYDWKWLIGDPFTIEREHS